MNFPSPGFLTDAGILPGHRVLERDTYLRASWVVVGASEGGYFGDFGPSFPSWLSRTWSGCLGMHDKKALRSKSNSLTFSGVTLFIWKFQLTSRDGRQRWVVDRVHCHGRYIPFFQCLRDNNCCFTWRKNILHSAFKYTSCVLSKWIFLISPTCILSKKCCNIAKETNLSQRTGVRYLSRNVVLCNFNFELRLLGRHALC